MVENETEKKIGQKKAHCIWPGCTAQQFMSIAVQLMKQENGQLVPVKDIQIPTPMCDYHSIFAMKGLCAAIEQPNIPGKYGFAAPVDTVDVAEATLSAWIFSGRLQEQIAAVDKARQKAKEAQEVQHEHKVETGEAQGDKPADNHSNEQRSESEQGKAGEPKPQNN